MASKGKKGGNASGNSDEKAWEEVSRNEFVVLQKFVGEKAPSKCGRVISALSGNSVLVVAEAATADVLAERMGEFEANTKLFISAGLTPAKAVETLRNNNLTVAFKEMIEYANAVEKVDKAVGTVLYTLAAKMPVTCARHRKYIAELCAAKKIRQTNVEAVGKYMTRVGDKDLDVEGFERDCGVGVVVTREQIAAAIAAAIEPVRAELVAERYAYDVMGIFKGLRNVESLKWADNREVKEEFDKAILCILGEKTKEDMEAAKKAPKKGKKDKGAEGAAAAGASGQGIPTKKTVDHGLRLPMPKENLQLRPSILEAHLARTGGKLMTRFPPEPNGFLHIGHAKSMHLNFGLAEKFGGECYLRLDDTNPERENMVYINSIMDNVEWLGHHPWKVTHASSYFDQLYECAIELIKRGKAYVCHQTSEEISKCREVKAPSPWRDRPVRENLELFEQMRQGRFKEGEATLRMKMDITSDNPCMWDLVAYRIRYVPHPVTGNKYCIYPSYDFTHCLNDSFEDIDLSLCTLEFLVRRPSYYWLLDALEMYRPVVWEFSRLNITRTVMSKRKLLTLVTQKMVHGWDDPRMPTLNGLRRRGYSADAINHFCDIAGVTTNTTVFLDYTVLEQVGRQDMEVRCNRAMGVLDPLLVELTNVAPDQKIPVTRPNHPVLKERGTNTVELTHQLYIDRNDFKLEDKKDFWGLAPGKSVRLRYANAMTCTEVVKDAEGKIVKLRCEYDHAGTIKPNGFVHWVSKPDAATEPCVAEVRLYEPLFMSDRPDELTDWKLDLNPNSEVITQAFVDPVLASAKPGDAFQFERVGFFVCDIDSTPERPVFIRTVSLKESKDKKSL